MKSKLHLLWGCRVTRNFRTSVLRFVFDCESTVLGWGSFTVCSYISEETVSVYLSDTETCNWRRLARKCLAGAVQQSKTLDNIPASCLKINNPDPGIERTQDRPHTAVISPPPLTPLDLPFLHPLPESPKLSCVSPVLCSPLTSPLFVLFLSLCLSSAGRATEVNDIGKSCKKIRHLADLYNMHAFVSLQVHL